MKYDVYMCPNCHEKLIDKHPEQEQEMLECGCGSKFSREAGRKTMKKKEEVKEKEKSLSEVFTPESLKEIPIEEVKDEEVGQKKYELMESEDEKQIIEMDSETMKTLVYKVRDDFALSYAGVKECARMYKNIHFGIHKVVETKDAFCAYAFAINLKDNLKALVPKRQLKKFSTGAVNEFAFEIACSKAIRNAIKTVVPTQYIASIINQFIKREAGKK